MCDRIFMDSRDVALCYTCESNVVQHVPQLPPQPAPQAAGPPIFDNEAMVKLFRDFLAQQKK